MSLEKGDRVELIGDYYGLSAGTPGTIVHVGRVAGFVSFQPDGSPRVFTGMNPDRFKTIELTHACGCPPGLNPEHDCDLVQGAMLVHQALTHEPIRIKIVVDNDQTLFDDLAQVEQIEPGTFVVTAVKEQLPLCRSVVKTNGNYYRCELYEGHLVDVGLHAGQGVSWADAEADGTIVERER